MSYSPEVDENTTNEVIGAEYDSTSVINQEIGIDSKANLQVDSSTILILGNSHINIASVEQPIF